MHPETASWIEFVDGALSAAAREEMQRHLDACEACRSTEREIRAVVDALGSPAPPEPSAAAVHAAVRAFHALRLPAGLPQWARDLPQRVVRLAFDTFAQPQLAFAGARAGSAARRVRFEAEDLELDVLVEARGERRRLLAQLLALGGEVSPISAANFFVSVGGRLVTAGVTNDHGEFLSDVGVPGAVQIFVRAHDALARFHLPEDPGGDSAH
jgi:anti-sigma factor RsiW